MKFLIVQNFSVRVIDRTGVEKKITYSRGMVIEDIPAGQTAGDWERKGLVKAVKPKITAGAPTV